MTKQQLIDAIRRLNPTAAESYLSIFDELDLNNYLFRLRFPALPRSAEHGWARPGNTSAIVTRAARPAT